MKLDIKNKKVLFGLTADKPALERPGVRYYAYDTPSVFVYGLDGKPVEITGGLSLNTPEVSVTFNIPGHGFSMLGANNNVPIPATIDSITNLPVQADASDIANECFGFLEVVDVNNVRYFSANLFYTATAHGLNVGELYYLTDGGGLAPNVTSSTNIQKILEVIDDDTLNLTISQMMIPTTPPTPSGGNSQYVRQFMDLCGLTVTDRWRGYSRNSVNMLAEDPNASYGTGATPSYSYADINKIFLKNVEQITEISFYHINASSGGQMDMEIYIFVTDADASGSNMQLIANETWSITNAISASKHDFTINAHTTLDADSTITVFMRSLSTGATTTNTLQSVQLLYKFD